MEYKNLGNSGLRVSVVGLGCNNFGRRCDQAATTAVVEKALDSGVTLFDTADVYGPRGLSEEFLGVALKGKRREAIIATKFMGPMGEGTLWSGASRRYIFDAIDASLKRLDTDYVDLYQIHFPDVNTPIAETMRALDEVVRSGRARYVGCSNFAGWQVVEAQWVARSGHFSEFVSAQNQYNLLDRRIERELVPAASAYGMGVLPYFPLASGFLTGKYRSGEAPPEGTRLAAGGGMADRVLTEGNFETLQKLESFAESAGHTMLELAIGWLASQPHVSSVISGATKPEQVEQNVAASEWKLNAEEMAKVNEITRR
ncbi:MAG: aldo/keto reductase [Chloroflexi bacterium]|nr:aldo/keto reductase [Chloroflexota bacterium]